MDISMHISISRYIVILTQKHTLTHSQAHTHTHTNTHTHTHKQIGRCIDITHPTCIGWLGNETKPFRACNRRIIAILLNADVHMLHATYSLKGARPSADPHSPYGCST